MQTSDTPETVTLTLDMQADFRRQMVAKRLGFGDLAAAMENTAITPRVLVDWVQKSDPRVLKSEWDAVVQTLGSLSAVKGRRTRPNEDDLLFGRELLHRGSGRKKYVARPKVPNSARL